MSIPSTYGTSAVGVSIKSGKFATVGKGMPIRVALLGEANISENATVPTMPTDVISSAQVASMAGHGSPLHLQMKYLETLGVPVTMFAQRYSTTSVPTVSTSELTITGTATLYGTVDVVINGIRYKISFAKGDLPAVINQKIRDAVNGILSAPVVATDAAGKVLFTTKWKGKTSASLNVRIDSFNVVNGFTFAFVNVSGTGTPDIQPALDQFGATHYNLVCNPYGEDAAEILETFNGVPGDVNTAGRWSSLVNLPFIAVCGSNRSLISDITGVTNIDARRSQATNAFVASANFEWFPFEGAAAALQTYGNIAANTPHLGMYGVNYIKNGVQYGGAGDMATLAGRNAIYQLGHGTSEYVDGKIRMTDFITTYNPSTIDRRDQKFVEVRDLIVDMNIMYAIRMVCERDIYGKSTTADNTTVRVTGVIKPKEVRELIAAEIANLAKLGFIATPEFSVDSISITLNPQYRYNISFKYQRTSLIKQVDCGMEVDFYTVI
jgi:phage tail sheath gpL-like